MSTPRLVEAHPVPASSIGDAVRDDALAVYIRGEYAGRLCRSRGGWTCDAELTRRIPWPRGARTYFATAAAGIRSIRRRIRDAERAAKWGWVA